jgi:hypothetical protein
MEPIILRGGPWEGEPTSTSPDTRIYYDHARDRNVRYEDSGEVDPMTGRRIFDYRPR